MKLFIGLFFVCCTGTLLNSCSNSTDSGSAGTVIPHAGSVFLSREIVFDTTGGTGTSIDTEMTIDSVIANGTAWHGRNVSYLSLNQTDTSGIVLESNGDISVYVGPTPLDLQDVGSKNVVDFGWVTLPTGSHTNAVVRTIDTTLVGSPAATDHVVLSVSYIGSGSVTVGSESLPVSIARFTLQKTLSDGTQTVNSTDQLEISFSNRIGHAAMIKFFHSTIPNTADEEAAGTQTLLSYTLK